MNMSSSLSSFLLTPLIATCVAILFFSVFYYLNQLTKNKGDPSKPQRLRLPPGPRGWPIVGNLLQLGPLPHRDFAALTERYGPLVYLRLGSVGAITTGDPTVIREILLRQDECFASRPRTAAAQYLAYRSGDVALAPLGAKWKRMRRLCMEHLLTTRRLESFAAQRAEEARHLIREVWARATMGVGGGSGGEVDLRAVLGAFSMNNVTRMLLGKQYYGAGSSGPEEAEEFMKITHDVFRWLGVIYLGDYLPMWRWVDPSGCEREMREVENRVDAFHSKIIDEHRKAAAERQLRKKKVPQDIEDNDADRGRQEDEMDFVDVLLSLPGDDGKEHLDDVDIKALMQDMIAAATDTSAVTSEWAMTELIRNPRVLAKVQHELDTVVGRHRLVTEPDLPNLPYLRCVVRETFRTHPAGPFLIPHESVSDTTLMGYDIPAGTRVFINVHALGRNPKVWGADIPAFRPERHEVPGESRVEISHGPDFKILPFSAGKRKCPGAPLGVTFVLLALARLLQGFDWAPPEGVRPEEVENQEVYGLTMPREKPLVAVARPRLASRLYH